MGNDERNPNLNQDLPQHRVYRLTAAGKTAFARPEGRVSRGFLRLLVVLDGVKNLQRVQQEMSYLTLDDLILWCDELVRQKLVERIDDTATSAAHVYSGFIDFERDAEFASTVGKICSALDRTQPMPDRPDPENQRFVATQTARLVAIEALSTTRRITVHGFLPMLRGMPTARASHPISAS